MRLAYLALPVVFWRDCRGRRRAASVVLLPLFLGVGALEEEDAHGESVTPRRIAVAAASTSEDHWREFRYLIFYDTTRARKECYGKKLSLVTVVTGM